MNLLFACALAVYLLPGIHGTPVNPKSSLTHDICPVCSPGTHTAFPDAVPLVKPAGENTCRGSAEEASKPRQVGKKSSHADFVLADTGNLGDPPVDNPRPAKKQTQTLINSNYEDTNQRQLWLAQKVDLNQLPSSSNTELYASGLENMRERVPPELLPLPNLIYQVVINPDVLAPYNFRIKASLDLISEKYNFRSYTRQPEEKIPDLPVYMVSRLDPQDHKQVVVPRIVDTKNKLCSPYAITGVLSTLIKCVMFSQRALLNRMNTTPEEAVRQRISLMDWLLERFFSSDGQIPIFGEIQAAEYYRRKLKFKPIQRHLINHLHSHTDPRSDYTSGFTSHVVIGIWYLQQHPSKWTEHFDNQEMNFWAAMKESLAVINDVKSKSVLRTEPWGSQEYRDWGNFKIADLEEVLSPLTSKRSWVKARFPQFKQPAEELSVLEEEILYRRHTVYSDALPVNCRKRMLSIKTIPHFTGLQCNKRVQKVQQGGREIITIEDIFLIRLLGSTVKENPGQDVDKRLKILMSVLRGLYNTLNIHLKKLGRPFLPNSNPSYLEWLSGVLFDKEHSFPILGWIPQELVSSYTVQFTPIQQQIILSLTSRRTNTHLFTDTAGFLGYWCKNYQPEYWHTYFKDESGFGKLLLNAIIMATSGQR
ncbi:hypothetical protein PGT21_031812 [Puccinia graminis f. sp. tritici]|uniref:Uncharacterized protein n=1 Tax=Puccinia graminis f. sp. tritici TaxID=56615 RepID=A0A5B0R537_PUCGR|nr:hypothetical protein PGT21_031812 [Puccinia graminis f. sp. tritici]KAA1120620.1 hypothetical protein PGTUg99_011674 [Puccinia graminis f. sp. tritici]